MKFWTTKSKISHPGGVCNKSRIHDNGIEGDEYLSEERQIAGGRASLLYRVFHSISLISLNAFELRQRDCVHEDGHGGCA